MPTVNTLIDRLQEVMNANGWDRQDLVRVSGQSSSVVSQWLGHGSKVIKSIGKQEAAEAIAAASGYCALWLAKGKGPKHPAAITKLEARSTQGVYATPLQVLAQMQQLLTTVDPELRGSFADILHGWARTGGAEDRSGALMALLRASEKQRRAG